MFSFSSTSLPKINIKTNPKYNLVFHSYEHFTHEHNLTTRKRLDIRSRKHKKAQAALMYDAVFVLVEAFNKLLRKKPDQFRSYTMRNRMGQLIAPVTNVSSANSTNNANANRVLDCNTSKGWVNPWEHGDKISRYLRKVLHYSTNIMTHTHTHQFKSLRIFICYMNRFWCRNSAFTIGFLPIYVFFSFFSSTVYEKVEIEGLTGDIRFNEDGRRENYTLNIMEMTVDSGLVKVADWSDRYGFVLMKTNAAGERVQARIDYERNRTYVVTTILEEPYLMLRKGKPGKVLEGNELYEGYCKDLADLIAHKLGINCMSRQMDCYDFGAQFNPQILFSFLIFLFLFSHLFSSLTVSIYVPNSLYFACNLGSREIIFFVFGFRQTRPQYQSLSLCCCRNEDVLRTVKDGSYGIENPNEVGGWDGIVGELVRRVCFNVFPVRHSLMCNES